MDGLRAERLQIQRLVAEALGRDVNQPQLTVGQARVDGLQADLLVYPVDISEYAPLQNEDGVFYFTLGVVNPYDETVIL